jgi:hypothetical protein
MRDLDRYTLANHLRAAAYQYETDAAEAQKNINSEGANRCAIARLVAQFYRQAREAIELANNLEEGKLIKIS